MVVTNTPRFVVEHVYDPHQTLPTRQEFSRRISSRALAKSVKGRAIMSLLALHETVTLTDGAAVVSYTWEPTQDERQDS